MFHNNNRGRSNNRAPVRAMKSLQVKTNKTSKLVNATTPFRVRAKKQMVSIPNHNNQLKIRKMFRIVAGVSTTTTQSVSTGSCLTAIQLELGISTTTTAGESVQIHEVRAYSMGQQFYPATQLTAIPNTMTLQLFDIENATASGSNAVGLFDDYATPSGVCHVSAVYPVNDRPTFNRGTTAATLFVIASPIGNFDVIDIDATYIRTSSVTN